MLRRTLFGVSAFPNVTTSDSSLCNLCVLCVSVVIFPQRMLNHRDTENTEVAQRKPANVSYTFPAKEQTKC